MDPQAFVRLSVGSLGLRIPLAAPGAARDVLHASSCPCSCEIRLQGFPVQKAAIPVFSVQEANPDPSSNASIFYLEDSDVKALLTRKCFQDPQAYLEIAVYMGKQGSNCGFTSKKHLIGIFRVNVGPEWGEGKPALLHSGWISIGKNKQEAGRPGPELHLRVKLDPDPRYVFQFEDETALSPQIVQIQGTIKQPIFSCKFSRDRRVSHMDFMHGGWSNAIDEDRDTGTRERKGWKVMIHDLSGSAIASAFMATPFVPSTGHNRVARSNPGAWLILRPDPIDSSASWHPWGRLEAWRETNDLVCLRLHLLPEGEEAGFLVSEVMINTEKGGEFFIDMDKQAPVGAPLPIPHGSADESATPSRGAIAGGFVMNCRVHGERKRSKPLVQLASRKMEFELQQLFMSEM